ncbi:MAG: aldo/keto reductase, partial [Candidatus Marinimicrobia bacterium]|nr:aldo/keto reductase [Candidatus Neomarinimicrobiota bacterium]
MPRNLTIESTVTLNNGLNMPLFGLGTYQAHGREVEKAVRAALDEGYRLIDTAAMYGNEAEVGKAIRESGIAREDIFVTTKLWNSDHGYENAMNAFENSLTNLDIEYIDLFLIHWPVERLRAETWQAF